MPSSPKSEPQGVLVSGREKSGEMKSWRLLYNQIVVLSQEGEEGEKQSPFSADTAEG
jgi:hypothetical protein